MLKKELKKYSLEFGNKERVLNYTWQTYHRLKQKNWAINRAST